MIRGAGVKLREHLPAPALEAGLEIMCVVRDLCGIGSRTLGLFHGVGQYWAVPPGHTKELLSGEGRRRAQYQRQHGGKQRVPDATEQTIASPQARRAILS
ncbi:MAG: hypothetical protein ACXU9O_04280 [Gemmatimonadaceae bacterium]